MSLPIASEYDRWMGCALDEAAQAAETGDVPVGAVVLSPAGAVLARARNRREIDKDPIAHAEVLAIQGASRSTGSRFLDGCTLVVTLEPCVMCAGAILAARVETVVFGSWDEKAGAGGSRHDLLRDRTLPHRCTVIGGVRADESAAQLRGFFAERRG